MTDQSGALSEEEQIKIRDWIDDKREGRGMVCSICHTANWSVGPHLVFPPIFSGGLRLGGAAYPYAMIVCSNCGHTMFINSVMMGLTPPERKSEDEPQKGKDGEGAENG
jgi:hypothetical protein